MRAEPRGDVHLMSGPGSTRIFTSLNGAIALAFGCMAAYVFFTARITADTHDATLFLGAAAWFGAIAYGFAVQNRPLVIVMALPVVIGAGVFACILLFAPLAWGDRNLPAIYLMQGGAVGILVLQVSGVFSLFTGRRAQREKDGQQKSA